MMRQHRFINQQIRPTTPNRIIIQTPLRPLPLQFMHLQQLPIQYGQPLYQYQQTPIRSVTVGQIQLPAKPMGINHYTQEPKTPVMTLCQQGFDKQEENKILNSYIAQMEKTIESLQNQKQIDLYAPPNEYSYSYLLQQQNQENIEMKGKIEILLKEIEDLKEEGQYLKKLKDKQS